MHQKVFKYIHSLQPLHHEASRDAHLNLYHHLPLDFSLLSLNSSSNHMVDRT